LWPTPRNWEVGLDKLLEIEVMEMPRLKFLLFAAVIALVLVGCSDREETDMTTGEWSLQDTGGMDMGAEEFLAAVAFADTQHGWVVGSDLGGEVIPYTADSGQTWTIQQKGSGLGLYDVGAVDLSHVWAMGIAGTVLKFNR
jgi:hypothetical protein